MKLSSIQLSITFRRSSPLTEISISKLMRDASLSDFLSVDRATQIVYPNSAVDIPASIIADKSTPWGMPLGVFQSDINEQNQLQVAPTLAIHLHNVALSSAAKLLIYDGHFIIQEYLGPDFHAMGMRWLSKSYQIGKLSLTRHKTISDDYVSYDTAIEFSTEIGDNNVYHWIAHVLPKIKFVKSLPSTIPLAFAYQPNNFQKECLAFFGINNPILIFDPNKVAKFKSLVLIEGPWAVGNPPQTNWLVNEALSRISTQKESISQPLLGNKIFIFRGSSARRRMVNQSQVKELLEKQGFQSYDLENFSFRDCVALFSEANEIIFEHGASGIWLMFAKPGTVVLEILPERNHASSKELSNYYFWLGLFSELKFQYLICKNLKADPWAEYAVDIVALQDKVSKLFT